MCYSGYYLSMDGGNYDYSFGTCVAKTSTNGVFSLYVSPSTSVNYNAQLLDGSLTNPFLDIRDALTRAYEVCAPYSNVCSVTIYLTAGTHYVFRNYRQFYRPTEVDYYSQNVKMTI